MVSIIIPVYNVEKYLEKCLESVIHQTYKGIEIILVDDGSTDRSGVICDEYAQEDQRIRVIHQTNAGVSAARNTGLDTAKGEWILFVDSDDWIHTELLEICFKYLTEKTDICFFGFREVEKESTETTIEKVVVKQILEKDFLGLQYRIFNRDREACCSQIVKLSSPCKIFRKKMLNDNKLRFPEQLVNGEDGVFNLYAYQYAKEAICIENPLYFYRIRSDSVTNKYTENIEKDFANLHKAHHRFIEETQNRNLFKDVLRERLIWSFSFFCILKYCHPDNPNSYAIRKKQFLSEYCHYEQAIQNVSLKNFGLRKKIIFFAIKRRWFLIVTLLCCMQAKARKWREDV